MVGAASRPTLVYSSWSQVQSGAGQEIRAKHFVQKLVNPCHSKQLVGDAPQRSLLITKKRGATHKSVRHPSRILVLAFYSSTSYTLYIILLQAHEKNGNRYGNNNTARAESCKITLEVICPNPVL